MAKFRLAGSEAHAIDVTTQYANDAWRMQRLHAFLGWMLALVNAGGHDHIETFNRIASVHDHKGMLVIEWRDDSGPHRHEQKAAAAAWEALDGVPDVTHDPAPARVAF